MRRATSPAPCSGAGSVVATASPVRRFLFRRATSGSLERLVTATGPGRRAAWRRAQRYVAGTELQDALRIAEDLARDGLAASIDLFGERTHDPGEADRIAGAYVELAGALGRAPRGTGLSLDLSHHAVAADPAGALRRVERIADALPAGARLQIGAEEAALTDAVLDTVLQASPRAPLTATVQANLRRSAADAARLAEAGVPIRLVKGAYVEPATVAVAYGEPTDLAYLRLARQLGDLQAEVSLATHDAVLREACRAVLPAAPIEMLLGVRPDVARSLTAAETTTVRIYVPYGPNWFRYAMRRVAESRGA